MATNTLLPLRPPVEIDRDPECVPFDDADDVFDVLTSETARSILAALYEEPSTVSDVAERVDTSLQNADYHLTRLAGASLVEVVDTWYSEKGVEMDVYAPTSDPLVVFAGDDDAGDAVSTAAAEAGAPGPTP